MCVGLGDRAMNRDKQIELLRLARERQQALAAKLIASPAFQATLQQYDAEPYIPDLKRA